MISPFQRLAPAPKNLPAGSGRTLPATHALRRTPPATHCTYHRRPPATSNNIPPNATGNSNKYTLEMKNNLLPMQFIIVSILAVTFSCSINTEIIKNPDFTYKKYIPDQY
ncbi:MAG: hypothetical protein MZV63_34375 [Marinilabiliales bacterium]|nr:hypothetical protein [Marinilabiliales bacterium]